MHWIPKIFANSSSRRKAGADGGKPKPRLERLNARKNIDYEFCPASSSPSCYFSEESLRNRSGDLYGGQASFRVDGNDAGIEGIFRALGFSGIDDFAIPAEEYEAMKVGLSAPVVFSRKIGGLTDWEVEVNCDEDVELSDDTGGIGVAADAINSKTERNNSYIGLTENSHDVISQKSEGRQDLSNTDGDGANLFGSRLMDSIRVTDTVSGRSNELRGKGIKGVRPPVLAPPPIMSLPVIDKDCSTWDILHQLSGSCSFTTTSNDDDSSSTSTDPISSISSDGRFKRVILEWQKGELLGRGSFGSVYEGIADNGFFFAVKEVSLLDRRDEGKQRIIQLEQEIALLSQFEHENIVQYYGTKRDESHLYIFLELVTKGSLLNLYQKYILRDSQVSAYTRQILHGLKYLHDRKVVHRDIKCANILVDANGLVKLADFGLAKATKLNDVNSCKGTAFWMAPEIVRSRGYGLAADIWSLGCTVLEMLTRRFPYHNLECMPALFRIGSGERPPIPDSLSSDAQDFIVKCLQVDPCLRPSAAQLLDHPFVKQLLPSFSGLASPQYFTRQI